MFLLLTLPSDILTLDVVVEEVTAPMEDGSLPMPPLYVARPPAHLHLRREGLPLSLQRFPGYRQHAFCWVPYGLYDCMVGMWAQGIILDIAGVADMSPRIVSYFSRYVVPL